MTKRILLVALGIATLPATAAGQNDADVRNFKKRVSVKASKDADKNSRVRVAVDELLLYNGPGKKASVQLTQLKEFPGLTFLDVHVDSDHLLRLQVWSLAVPIQMPPVGLVEPDAASVAVSASSSGGKTSAEGKISEQCTCTETDTTTQAKPRHQELHPNGVTVYKGPGSSISGTVTTGKPGKFYEVSCDGVLVYRVTTHPVEDLEPTKTGTSTEATPREP